MKFAIEQSIPDIISEAKMLSEYSDVNHFSTASKIQEISQHTQILNDWSLCYNQLSAGKFEGSLNQLNFDGIQIYEEKLTPSIFQRGEAKENSLCIGVFSKLSEPALWKGKILNGNEIISVCRGEEIMLRTPDHSSFFALSIPLSLFNNTEYSLPNDGINMLNHPILANKLHENICFLLNSLLHHPLQVATRT